MDIKLIALDVDRTLLTTKQEVTPATQRALERAYEKGIHIVLSTGRLVVECEQILAALPCIRYINGCTGAEVVDLWDGHTVAGRRISGEEARRLYGLLKDLNVMLCAFDPKDRRPHCRKDLWDYAQQVLTPAAAEHLRKYYIPEQDFEHYLDGVDSLIKFYIPCFSQEDMQTLKRRMEKEPYTVLQCAASEMEIMPVGADKADGLDLLTQALGLKACHVMAVGDSENDLSMLRWAGLAVCMANGSAEAKVAADYITDDNDHDGVAKAVNMVLEGKWGTF